MEFGQIACPLESLCGQPGDKSEKKKNRLEKEHIDGWTCSASFVSVTHVPVHWLPPITHELAGESDPRFPYSLCLFRHDSRGHSSVSDHSLLQHYWTLPFYFTFAKLNRFAPVFHHHHLLLLLFYSRDRERPRLWEARAVHGNQVRGSCAVYNKMLFHNTSISSIVLHILLHFLNGQRILLPPSGVELLHLKQKFTGP